MRPGPAGIQGPAVVDGLRSLGFMENPGRVVDTPEPPEPAPETAALLREIIERPARGLAGQLLLRADRRHGVTVADGAGQPTACPRRRDPTIEAAGLPECSAVVVSQRSASIGLCQ